MWETWVLSLCWEDPRRRERLPTPVFWPGKFHGLNSPWGPEESDMIEWLSPKPPPPNNSLTSFSRTGTISKQKAPQSSTLTILPWGLLESIFYSLPQNILSKNSLPMYHSTAISSIRKKKRKRKTQSWVKNTDKYKVFSPPRIESGWHFLHICF